jgi:hypothetical protein
VGAGKGGGEGGGEEEEDEDEEEQKEQEQEAGEAEKEKEKEKEKGGGGGGGGSAEEAEPLGHVGAFSGLCVSYLRLWMFGIWLVKITKPLTSHLNPLNPNSRLKKIILHPKGLIVSKNLKPKQTLESKPLNQTKQCLRRMKMNM